MPSLRSGLTIHASEPMYSEQTNPLPEPLLHDSMTGEEYNHETVTPQPEDDNESLTGDTGVEQESATDLPTLSSAVCVAVEPRSNSILDKPTDISAESDFLSLGEQSGETATDTGYQIDIFLDKSLVGDITRIAAPISKDTSFGDGSQVQPGADHWLLVPDCHAESGDKSACGLASNQPPLSIGDQGAKPMRSDNSEPGQAFLEMAGEDIVSAIMIIDEDTEQTVKTDSVIEIIDDDAEQTTKPRRNGPRNVVKRSFKDFVNNGNLWMGNISQDLDEIMKLTDDILATSGNVVKRAKLIKKQLIESQKLWR